MVKHKSNRARQTKRGQDTVNRVKQYLLEKRNAIKVEVGKGSYGEPDLKTIWQNGRRYGCEIKRCKVMYTRKKTGWKHVGQIFLTRNEWNDLLEWCNKTNSRPLFITEIYIPSTNKGHLYFKIKGDLIQLLFEERTVEWLSLTVWDIIRKGEKL